MTLSLARLAALEPPTFLLDVLEEYAFDHPGTHVEVYGDHYVLRDGGRILATAPMGATA